MTKNESSYRDTLALIAIIVFCFAAFWGWAFASIYAMTGRLPWELPWEF